ncbi:MAG: tyrosine-type recombinase/integrase, partial [Bryobacterales bacterium]|nr:tyrosine-type recombinase/integrase [Bryobacterales bacterium]
MTYLEKHEMDALLAVPDRTTAQGRREYAVLVFLYNTGARVSELTRLTVGDLQLADRPESHSLVTLHGKRGRIRRVPVWP